jgi:WhiB family transcriptional regulator, redox-sensing transcriptional regulator
MRGISVNPESERRRLARARSVARANGDDPAVATATSPNPYALPRLVIDDPGGWREHAECKGSPELFFPGRGETHVVRAAKAICERCPVADECLAFALHVPTLIGVWGGTSEKERRRLRSRSRVA